MLDVKEQIMRENSQKVTLQEQRDFYSAIFGDSCPAHNNVSIEEVDSAIADCKAMLDYAIDRSDKTEISYWRRLLQENKVYRREILNT